MAVSKRTRFEVLRRDEYTCRYCRATDQPLVIDHVIPVALGGGDDPGNLVAACRDCNAGKSSASPDAATVADVQEGALRHAALIEDAYAILVERLGERDDYIDEFAEAFLDKPVPSDWRESVGRWFDMGVPIELIVDAAQKAAGSTRHFHGTDRFRYLCGIVWNQIHVVTEAASAHREIEGSFITKDALQQIWREKWNDGFDAGVSAELARVIYCDPLSLVVDKWRPIQDMVS